MRMCQNCGPCYKSVLLTITTSACLAIVIFFFQFTSDRENPMKREISIQNEFHSEKLTEEKCIPVCTSKSCIKQADFLLRSIKPSNDPCENFYKFLCGTYLEKADQHSNSSMILDMKEAFMIKLKNIIENIEEDPGSGAGKMKIMYGSCINLGSSELRGFEHFKQFLDKVEIHNWPYLPADFKFSEFGLSKLLAIFTATANVIQFQFISESMNEDEELGLNETFVKISVFSQNLHLPPVQRDAAADILNFFAIESKEIEILLNDYEEVRNALTRFNEEFKMDDEIRDEDCPNIWIDCSTAESDEWVYLCEAVKIYLNVTKIKPFISKREIAIPVYWVENAKNFIPRLKSLPDRSVANYFALTLLWNRLDEVNFFFRRKSQKYFNYLKHDWKEHEPSSNRWVYCVSWIINNMRVILQNEVVKSFITTSFMEEVHDIHQNLTSAVNEMINKQEWLSTVPKSRLMMLIENLECNMVNLQRLLPNDTYANELLKMFNPTRDNFFQNILDYYTSQMHIHFLTQQISDLEFRYKDAFLPGAQIIESNEIVLKYGMFFPPVYYANHKKIVNMIQLAPVIVHEIGHAVIKIIEIISESFNTTKDVFSQRKNCIENQLGEFKFPILDENLNGTQFYEESLSDNMGYAIADQMIDGIASSENAFLLPGLPYTTKQLFYMSSRQVYCSKITREAEIFIQKCDTHPPNFYRLIESAQNSKGYSEAFHCPEGSYMNPKDKCALFDSI